MWYYSKLLINEVILNNKIEKNLLKTIIFTFIAISSSMILAISFFYVENTKDNFQRQMSKYKDDYYLEIKDTLKMKLRMITDILDYNTKNLNLSKEEIKNYTIDFLSSLTFDQNSSNYIFVYEVKNWEGGDDFAKMVVNPNRPDLFGKDISTNEEDGNGKKFREEFLKNIKEDGYSYTTYSYKKPDSKELQYKLSYFEYYPTFNWIVAAGVYIDDIENELKLKKEEIEKEIKKQILQNIVLFLLFLVIAIFALALLSNALYKILKNYKQKVKENEKELKVLNKSLEEMISNIAHQWRQPLSEISSILMLIKLKYDTNTLEPKVMDKKIDEANNVLEYMSKTIDDFKGFFSTNKEKEEFYLNTLIEDVVNINRNILELNNIKIDINIDENLKIYNFLNEYQQVVLNILKNSKDVLIERKIKNPLIKIYSKKDDKTISLFIEDNGNGINVEPINKIFDAYFSTKKDSHGTGIGLYMSKMIVEKSLKGKIEAKNSKFGAVFEIKVVYKR